MVNPTKIRKPTIKTLKTSTGAVFYDDGAVLHLAGIAQFKERQSNMVKRNMYLGFGSSDTSIYSDEICDILTAITSDSSSLEYLLARKALPKGHNYLSAKSVKDIIKRDGMYRSRENTKHWGTYYVEDCVDGIGIKFMDFASFAVANDVNASEVSTRISNLTGMRIGKIDYNKVNKYNDLLDGANTLGKGRNMDVNYDHLGNVFYKGVDLTDYYDISTRSINTYYLMKYNYDYVLLWRDARALARSNKLAPGKCSEIFGPDSNNTPKRFSGDIHNCIDGAIRVLFMLEDCEVVAHLLHKFDLSDTFQSKMDALVANTKDMYGGREYIIYKLIRQGYTKAEIESGVAKLGRLPIDHLGVAHTKLSEMCRKYGVELETYVERILNGASVEEALQSYKGIIVYGNVIYKGLRQFCKANNLNITDVQEHLKNGNDLKSYFGNTNKGSIPTSLSTNGLILNTNPKVMHPKLSLQDVSTLKMKFSNCPTISASEPKGSSLIVDGYGFVYATAADYKLVHTVDFSSVIKDVTVGSFTSDSYKRYWYLNRVDHLGIVYSTVFHMCFAHQVNPIYYIHTVLSGGSLEEALNSLSDKTKEYVRYDFRAFTPNGAFKCHLNFKFESDLMAALSYKQNFRYSHMLLGLGGTEKPADFYLPNYMWGNDTVKSDMYPAGVHHGNLSYMLNMGCTRTDMENKTLNSVRIIDDTGVAYSSLYDLAKNMAGYAKCTVPKAYKGTVSNIRRLYINAILNGDTVQDACYFVRTGRKPTSPIAAITSGIRLSYDLMYAIGATPGQTYTLDEVNLLLRSRFFTLDRGNALLNSQAIYKSNFDQWEENNKKIEKKLSGCSYRFPAYRTKPTNSVSSAAKLGCSDDKAESLINGKSGNNTQGTTSNRFVDILNNLLPYKYANYPVDVKQICDILDGTKVTKYIIDYFKTCLQHCTVPYSTNVIANTVVNPNAIQQGIDTDTLPTEVVSHNRDAIQGPDFGRTAEVISPLRDLRDSFAKKAEDSVDNDYSDIIKKNSRGAGAAIKDAVIEASVSGNNHISDTAYADTLKKNSMGMGNIMERAAVGNGYTFDRLDEDVIYPDMANVANAANVVIPPNNAVVTSEVDTAKVVGVEDCECVAEVIPVTDISDTSDVEDTYDDVSEAEEVVTEVAEEVAEEAIIDVVPEITEEVASEITEEVASGITEEVASGITEEVASGITEEVTNEVVDTSFTDSEGNTYTTKEDYSIKTGTPIGVVHYFFYRNVPTDRLGVTDYMYSQCCYDDKGNEYADVEALLCACSVRLSDYQTRKKEGLSISECLKATISM